MRMSGGWPKIGDSRSRCESVTSIEGCVRSIRYVLRRFECDFRWLNLWNSTKSTMYPRLKLPRHLSFLFAKPACVPPFAHRCQSSVRNEIFFNLIKDYNRKHSVHIDLLVNAVKSIHRRISERRSLLVLTAAARFVHHISSQQRVELLETVKLPWSALISSVPSP